MDIKNVCPYYGKDDDYCDVGCGYISSHDVNMIIRFCSGRHLECTKYQELKDRNLDALTNSIRKAGSVLSGIHDLNKLQS